MGLSLSCLGAGARSADGIAPEDVHKSKTGPIQGVDLRAEKVPADVVLTPAPSVVIPWVISDVFRARDLTWHQSEDEKLKRELQLEAHAERLRDCWKKHQDDFTKSFAEELMKCIQAGQHTYNDFGEVTDFLVPLFGACRSNPSLHITRGSQELWHTVLEAFRRKHEQLAQGPEWAAPETKRWRERSSIFLHRMDSSIPYSKDKNFTQVSRRLAKAIKKITEQMSDEELRVVRAREKEAKKAIEAGMKAKKEKLKASLKKAPWDK